ncbi:hypothetical protein AVEN_194620-1 [Araneus ventricosus]|uniref:Uncharacterized protein n=1 Tax=Araneus ventricosus TaxID=182803 RepID=A0A4Y2A886_ARAVE|nr:hypothetical protein AVEN_194620-1 [Araneus ventricosus]
MSLKAIWFSQSCHSGRMKYTTSTLSSMPSSESGKTFRAVTENQALKSTVKLPHTATPLHTPPFTIRYDPSLEMGPRAHHHFVPHQRNDIRLLMGCSQSIYHGVPGETSVKEM